MTSAKLLMAFLGMESSHFVWQSGSDRSPVLARAPPITEAAERCMPDTMSAWHSGFFAVLCYAALSTWLRR